MESLNIYTPQNGEYFKTILDAVATLLATKTFHSAIEIIMILSVSMMGYQYVMGDKIKAMMRFVLTSFIVTCAILGIKVSVNIIDMQEAESGAGTALTVDHVPLGLALPASIISGLGYGITSVFSFVLHMPNELDYVRSGMIFGSRTWLAATNARLTMSPDLKTDLSSYIRQCIFSAKLLASHQITPQELVNSQELIKTYFENPSPVYRVILHDGQNLDCIAAAEYLRPRVITAAELEMARLGKVMARGDKVKFENVLSKAHEYYMGIADSAAHTLTQNILINETRDAAADAFAFTGADAALMNYTNTVSQQKMHIAEANTFWLASFRLPYFMTIMWMLTICIFPLIALLSLFPITSNVYVIFIQSQVYLWSWPPMFIFIHFFVSIAGSHKVTIFGEKTAGTGITFSNMDALASQHSTFAYTAGALAASVIVLAYYITKGLSSVLANAATHFGGMVQSVSVGEASSAAQGNVSMATYSGWNMNYDNTNAHKFDTNTHHAEGRSTMQMPNGALLSQNQDGSHVGNIQPAISSAAVSVHGSDRVVDALHQSASESFNHASQLRTAADSHMQAGLSQMKHFTENDSNDIRSGEGVSNTTNASIGQDLRIMRDAIDHHNKHRDSGEHASVEAALGYRVNSSHSLLGKGVALVTGSSIDTSLTARGSETKNWSTQDFHNSSDGKAFNDAYHHMLATVKNSHLDTADSHNLSGAEQIAANFSAGESLLKQASAEYSHGQQLQTAASHTQEDAKAIDDNLNQAYHEWVVDRYGSKGERVMLQADSESIAIQHQWANAFLNSNAGKTAIASQVHDALTKTNADVKKDYGVDEKVISESKNIQARYQQHGRTVDHTALKVGLSKIDPGQMHAAEKLQAQHRLNSAGDKSDRINTYVKDKIQTTEIKNKED